MKVLIATDGSPSAQSALPATCSFPLPPISHALIVSAAPAPAHARGSSKGDAFRRYMLELAKRAAEDGAHGLQSRFASVETRVVADDPRSAILDAARQWKAELIVLGASGSGVVRSMLLGSVSAAVARYAQCPVLVVRGAPSAFRHIAIGIDGSEGALAAARFVAGLALDALTRVRLVAVMEKPSFVADTPETSALSPTLVTWTEEMRSELTVALDTAKRIFSGSKATVETAFVDDRPVKGLLAECTEKDADLLVLGARGLGGFERFLLGSVSDAVLHRAACSVLIVKNA